MRLILSLALVFCLGQPCFPQPVPHEPRPAASAGSRWEADEHDSYLTWNKDLEPSNALRLHLDESLAFGLQHNLTLWVAEVEPSLAKTEETLAAGLFDPLFRSLVSRGGLSQLFATDINQILGYNQQLLTRAGLEQTTSMGVRYSVEYRTGTDSFLQSALGLGGISRRTTSTFFNLVVPLLRGAGRDANEGPLRAAEFRTRRATSLLSERTLETAALIQKTYWELVAKRKQMGIQLRAQSHARRLRTYLEIEIAEGRAAPYEAFEAEQNLGLIEIELEDRRRGLILQEQYLLRVMGLDPNLGRVVPLDDLSAPDEQSSDLQAWVEKALAGRPEIRAARLEIEALQAESVTLTNRLLPQLDLIGDYRTSTGSNLLGTDAWQVSLQLSLPIGNHQALARAERKNLELKQAQRIVERSLQDIVNDTSLAYKSLGFHQERWRRAQMTRSYALLRSQAEGERFLAGFTPAHRVVFAQQYEVLSLQKEAEAKLDYTLSRVDLERAVGAALPELLEKARRTGEGP